MRFTFITDFASPTVAVAATLLISRDMMSCRRIQQVGAAPMPASTGAVQRTRAVASPQSLRPRWPTKRSSQDQTVSRTAKARPVKRPETAWRRAPLGAGGDFQRAGSKSASAM